MLTYPFSVNRVQSCIRSSFESADWWCVIKKQMALVQLMISSSSLYPMYSVVLYVHRVSNLKAHKANQVTWGPEAGQGMNGHTRELCRGTAATRLCPLSPCEIDQHAHSIFRFSALSVTLILTCWVEQSLLWKGPGDVNLSWENVEVIWLWHLLVWTAKVSWGMTFSPSLFHMPP